MPKDRVTLIKKIADLENQVEKMRRVIVGQTFSAEVMMKNRVHRLDVEAAIGDSLDAAMLPSGDLIIYDPKEVS